MSDTNYAPSYEELEILENCKTYIIASLLAGVECNELLSDNDKYKGHHLDKLLLNLDEVIKSLHHKHMNYELRDVKLNKTK